MATPESFVKAEEQLLELWEQNHIFKRSVLQRQEAPAFSFFDGPPFANGLPHYGHMLASVLKDTVTRYWTMRGFKVERTFGWDCHGLPVETEVEKQLKIKSKSQIEKLDSTPALSIAKFGQLCRASVFKYQQEWRDFLNRIGRWADHDNEYATLDNEYTASVWWAFGELYKQGLVYQDYRVSPYCPRCGTPLSNFEVNQGYKLTKDPAIFIKFKLREKLDPTIWGQRVVGKDAYMLAWTTTPWTLPGNVALAVDSKAKYVAIQQVGAKGDILVFAKDRYSAVSNLQSDYQWGISPLDDQTPEVSGKNFLELQYEPLFDVKSLQSETSHCIYSADFVTMEEGTGVVHTAVMYGEDDFNLGKQVGLPQHHTVDSEGKFTADVPQWQGKFVKDVDREIIADLKSRGLLLGEAETIEHEYPFCYRCDSPLLYYALSSWFIKVTAIKDRLIEANNKELLTDAGGQTHEGIRWVPAHLRDGRFGKWLEGARDWAISRNRYWGAPLPIWQCDQCQELKVVSQQAELADQVRVRNTFFIMRHGEAENNVIRILSAAKEGGKYGLTQLGQEQIKQTAVKLQEELKRLNKKTDQVIIVTSPIRRTHESADILAKELKLAKDQVIIDERLTEMRLGSFEGRTYDEYEQAKARGDIMDSESPMAIARRMQAAVIDYNSRNTGKVYILVSHGDPIWLLQQQLKGLAVKPSHSSVGSRIVIPEDYPHKGEYNRLEIPWLDLHRPYIDEIIFTCQCGGTMRRVSEVFDCWFESGSMPYAQYGVQSGAAAQELVKNKIIPADFIAEGLDQTRGWFYTLHVLSVALFNEPAYKNVVVNGLILAADGKKLSKRLQNYTPPADLFAKWGVDPVRYFLLASTQIGEDYRFSDEGVQHTFRQVIQLLWNIVEFYKLYAPTSIQPLNISSAQELFESATHPVDKWMMARVSLTIVETTHYMNQFELTKAARQISALIDDTSTWFVRRSRERIKSGDKQALTVLRWALHQLAIITAPFTPFLAERVYAAVDGSQDSVHLADWPTVEMDINSKLKQTGEADPMMVVLGQMAQVRELAESIHALRAQANIKLRQPLAEVIITGTQLLPEYAAVLAEEVNVIEVKCEVKRGAGEWLELSLPQGIKVELRTDLTLELEAAGLVREFTRQINNLRKEQGLTVKDKITLQLKGSDKFKQIIAAAQDKVMEATLTASLEWSDKVIGSELEVGEEKVAVKIMV